MSQRGSMCRPKSENLRGLNGQGSKLVQIFRRIHAYLSFHVYLSDISHFSFLMHVTSKRGPYSFM